MRLIRRLRFFSASLIFHFKDGFFRHASTFLERVLINFQEMLTCLVSPVSFDKLQAKNICSFYISLRV